MAVQETTIDEQKRTEEPVHKAPKHEIRKRYVWSPVTDGRHKSSEEIEHDIDRTRHDMDSTLDRLSDRAHPKQLLDYVADLLQHGATREQTGRVVRNVAGSVGSTMRDSALPAMLAGAGIGWVVYNAQSHDGRSARSAFTKAREKVGHARGKAEERRAGASERAEHARGKAEEYRAKAGEQIGHARGEIEHRAHQARETYEEGRDTAQRLIQDQPLAVGIAALATGILAGLAFPPSHAEMKAMGGASETAKEQAAEAAAGATEAVKETVSETVGQPGGEVTTQTPRQETAPAPKQEAGPLPTAEDEAQRKRPNV